jgi:hypothetical protein
LGIALGVVALMLIAGAIAWLLWPQRTGITRANAAKIENGMALERVEMILGGAPRDESTGILDPDHKLGDVPGMQWREWRSDEVIVHVMLDRDGRLNTAIVVPVRRADTQEPLFARLRRLVGL